MTENREHTHFLFPYSRRIHSCGYDETNAWGVTGQKSAFGYSISDKCAFAIPSSFVFVACYLDTPVFPHQNCWSFHLCLHSSLCALIFHDNHPVWLMSHYDTIWDVFSITIVSLPISLYVCLPAGTMVFYLVVNYLGNTTKADGLHAYQTRTGLYISL